MSNLLKNKKLRNWSLILVILVAAFFVVRTFSPARASNATASSIEEVVSLNVTETIEASGSLEAQPFAALTWKTAGVVEKVNVKPGDQVKKGEILLALQPESTTASIVSAQADLINAQETLDDLLNSGTSLAQAAIDLKDAQEAYDKAQNYLNYLTTDSKVPQTMYSAKLVETRNGWRYEYDTNNYKGPAPKEWIVDAQNDLTLKAAQLQDAQREYDRLLAGEASTDVLAAQANVEAAQATVNSLYILAPFDGEVLSVGNVVGDLVDSGELAVNFADLSHLYVESQVDESDVANIKVGQQVEVTLDALSGVTFTGKVSEINPVGEEVSGLVKYTVRIDLDTVTNQSFLPLGTTANVVIHVKDATAALAVPITTVQNDANGEFVVVVQSDDSTRRVDIVSGAIVDDEVVVNGDLKAGDQVLVNNGSSFQAPNPFGGGEE